MIVKNSIPDFSPGAKTLPVGVRATFVRSGWSYFCSCAMVRQDRGGGAVPEGLMAACGDWAERKRMMRDGPRKREPPAGVCAGGWFKVS